MVSYGLEGIGQSLIDPLAVVVNKGGLAVHYLPRHVYGAAVGEADGLMPQADPKDGKLLAVLPNDVVGDAGLSGGTRSRRYDDALGGHSLHILQRNAVVAHHLYVGAQFRKVLIQVVGEAVVVIYEEDHLLFFEAFGLIYGP